MSSEINPSHNEVVETVLRDSHQTQDTTHIKKRIAGIANEMDNLCLGSSSHTDELKELGSDQVWEHFESLQGEDGTERAVCIYCRKKLVGSINIGTKHLQNHFERCASKGKIGGRHGDHKPAEGSLPFAWKLPYNDSLGHLIYECGSLLHNLADHVSNKITQIFEYVQEASSKEQNFQIAIERANSLGKEVTARVIDEEVYNDAEVCLKTAIGYKEAFFELENMDTEFKEINLTKEEWDQALALNNSFEELLNDFPDSHWEFNYETENIYFVLLCDLYNKSLLLPKFHLFFGDSEKTFNRFRNVMDECWSKDNFVAAAAAVLDPRFKLDIVQYWYKKIYGNEWEGQFTLFEDYFTDAYKEYARLYSSQSQPSDSLISSKVLDPSGRRCKSSNNLEDVSLQKSELDLFLEEVKFPSLQKFDVIKWWSDNKKYFPTLARMAYDLRFKNLWLSGSNDEE